MQLDYPHSVNDGNRSLCWLDVPFPHDRATRHRCRQTRLLRQLPQARHRRPHETLRKATSLNSLLSSVRQLQPHLQRHRHLCRHRCRQLSRRCLHLRIHILQSQVRRCIADGSPDQSMRFVCSRDPSHVDSTSSLFDVALAIHCTSTASSRSSTRHPCCLA